MVICLEQDANDLHVVQLVQADATATLTSLASLKSGMVFFTLLMPAYPGLTGKRGHQTGVSLSDQNISLTSELCAVWH